MNANAYECELFAKPSYKATALLPLSMSNQLFTAAFVLT